MSAALQQCWDPDAGYFGYATHDTDGAFTGLLRDDKGFNLNMGIDGVYPLVAGSCTSAQSDVLLDRLFSPDRLWTRIGISTVDQSAPYFDLNGYWNGQVWIVHQWFLFKAMLDLGRPELARRIAEAVLEVWSAESERTYNTWEHFSIATGRGNGWHQFGGLSAPVLNFFAVYHRLGNLTTGFDTRVLKSGIHADGSTLTADLLSLPTATGTASVVATLAPGYRYEVLIDGHPTRVDQTENGIVHITWTDRRVSQHRLGLSERSLHVRPIP
ncbi:hypothetical protein BH708_02560 [Brachybacterium sp. P6-10-X1]|nr:hypothetical protein BH708_02560 [Brachybacterium sp. P6-10-X1]